MAEPPKTACVSLQDPGLEPQAPRSRSPPPFPSPPAPGRGLPGRPRSQPATPLPEIVSPLPGGQPLPGGRTTPSWGWASVGPVRRRERGELGKRGNSRCCHRWGPQEALGAPEALGDRVDPARGEELCQSRSRQAREGTRGADVGRSISRRLRGIRKLNVESTESGSVLSALRLWGSLGREPPLSEHPLGHVERATGLDGGVHPKAESVCFQAQGAAPEAHAGGRAWAGTFATRACRRSRRRPAARDRASSESGQCPGPCASGGTRDG